MQSPRAAGVVAALLAVALYLPTVSNDFTYDDVPIVAEDARLADPWLPAKVWIEPWWPEGSTKGESRPLTTLTFWLHMQLHGPRPVIPHLVNIAIFGLLSYLAAVLAARWLQRPWAAWPVGLVFAAHPIHVETVAGIVGRAETMSAALAVVALFAWLQWRRRLTWLRAGTIALLVWLAGQSKETGYLIAAVIVLGELAERRREGRPLLERRWLVPMVVCLGSVAAVAAAQRWAVVRKSADPLARGVFQVHAANNPLVAASTAERLVTPLKLTGQAALLLLVPTGQSPDYSPRQLMPTASPTDGLVVLGAAVVLAWLATAGFAWSKRSIALGPLLALPVAWAVPSNTVVMIGTIFGERLLMLLSVFAPIALVGIVAEVAGQQPELRRKRLEWASWAAAVLWAGYLLLAFWETLTDANNGLDPNWALWWTCAAIGSFIGALAGWTFTRRAAPVVALGLAVLGYGASTLHYCTFWRSWPALVVSTALRHPRNGRFQGHLAAYLLDQAAQNSPGSVDWYDEAEQAARRALELWPDQTEPYRVLAAVARRRGDNRLAAQYERLAGGIPVSRQQSRKLAEAIRRLEQRIGPDLSLVDDVRLLDQYARLLLQYGDAPRLVEVYRRLIELEPQRWQLRVNAAIAILAAGGSRSQARRWIDEALRLDPDAPGPWAALAAWYEQGGQPAPALQAIECAIARVSPSDPRRFKYQFQREQLRKQLRR